MNVRGDKRNLMLVPSFMFQSLDFKLIVVIVSIVLLVVLLRFFIFMFLMVKFVMTLTV